MADVGAESQRLDSSNERSEDWRCWGPFLSERAWGTVREDYSEDGDAWSYFSHSQARKRAYRWSEDGLGGVTNRFCNVCFSFAFWNGKDPILKERLFGLSNGEGNHGEDVKELYFYRNNTPSHSLFEMTYLYPMDEFPYSDLLKHGRSPKEPELELQDVLSEQLEQGRFFEINVQWAKETEEAMFCRVVATNRSSEDAPMTILPQCWCRNTWSWGYSKEKPVLSAGEGHVLLEERHLGKRWLYCALVVEGTPDSPSEWIFTENETNKVDLFGCPLPKDGNYKKDAFHRYVCDGDATAVNPSLSGTKCAALCRQTLGPRESMEVWLLFSDTQRDAPFSDLLSVLKQRKSECDAFYGSILSPLASEEERTIQRLAYSGLLWSKQFYHFGVEMWATGDPGQPPPPPERGELTRNKHWKHLYALDVTVMPDKWEYPWFAVWDLAFHCVALAHVDAGCAKRQLLLFLREWYMHPNGALPAYEWNFDDANPPVHAWACLRTYQIDKELAGGTGDVVFLEKAFMKLLLHYTYWVNKKDTEGNNLFEGGFLGLDNIGVFDRSRPLPDGMKLEQADATAWIAFFSLNMLEIAIELATNGRPAFEDLATKFLEHFVRIGNSMSNPETGLWDPETGFFYDKMGCREDAPFCPITSGSSLVKIRSFVGLIPLFATLVIKTSTLEKLPGFRRRLNWFLQYRKHWMEHIHPISLEHDSVMLSIVNKEQLSRVLARCFDPEQFLSPHGVRSLSREYLTTPFECAVHEMPPLKYEAGESSSNMFGGNSNWRGPVWFPLSYLLVESLLRYGSYYKSSLEMECPVGSGVKMPLDACGRDIARRLVGLFVRDESGRRPCHSGESWRFLDSNPHVSSPENLLYFEYFNGDTGAGCGACHQTGWTALVASCVFIAHGERLGKVCIPEASE